MRIELGCLNRPWSGFALEEALAGIAAAGYQKVGLTWQQGRPVFSADSTEEEIAALKSRVAAHGLAAHVVITQPDLGLDPDEAVRRFQLELQRARWLGIEYVIMCGTEDEGKYEQWYAVVGRCLDCAGEHGITLLLKPHGGISALAEDLLRAAGRLDHPGFGICYDPGNIRYYTGLKPEDDLPKVARQVRAMCIKDEVGGKHGEVMITPGTGLVDFRRIFAILAEAGFSGPCWVECLGGKTAAEISAEAAKTRRFISDLAQSIG